MSRRTLFAAAALLLLLGPLVEAQLTVPITSAGTDIGAQINAAFVACGYNCAVAVPPGDYSYTTTIQMTRPSQSLIGAGSLLTILHYTGSGDGIKWQMNPFTIEKAGTLEGLSVVGTSSAANCVHSGSLTGSTWEDVTVSGCTGGSANGILLENALIGRTRAWTERTSMHNVHIGYTNQAAPIPGNTNGLVFSVNGGTYSFGYSDLDAWFNVESNQIGVLVGASAQLYHSTIAFKGNMDTGPASFLTVNGDLFQSTLSLFAELNVGSYPNAIHVGSTGLVNAQGSAQIWDGSGPGGIAAPRVDAGGFYVVEPWVSLDYPGTSSILMPNQKPMIETGYRPISSDGTIVVAQPAGSSSSKVAGDLQGRLVLSWPNNANRMATMIVDVACAQYESVVGCSLNVPVNYAYAGQAVFTNPTIKLSGERPGVPQIQVTIGNRNGASQNVIATWYGSAGAVTNTGAPILFPRTAPGRIAVPLVGLTSDAAGNLTTAQQMIVGSIKTAGTAPSCIFTSGGGAAPGCSLDAGSTNSAGTIIAGTGTGSPSGTGTITLTFNPAPFGSNKPVCQYQASDAGRGSWNGLAVMKDKNPSPSSDLFTWTNGTTPTNLLASTAYWISYHCWAK